MFSFGFLSLLISEAVKFFCSSRLLLPPSHFIVGLFVPQRLYGQENQGPGVESDLGETWCFFQAAPPTKESFHGSFRQPFGEVEEGGGSLVLEEEGAGAVHRRLGHPRWAILHECSFGALGIFILL